MPFLRSFAASAVLLAGLSTLAGCDSGSEDSSSNTPTDSTLFTVTTGGTHVSTKPTAGTSLYVGGGKTLTITVAPDAGYTVASAVGGTCPAGSWEEPPMSPVQSPLIAH